MLPETKIWLDKAKSDFELAIFLKNNLKFEASCFYSQQTIEKSLKALLIEDKSKLFRTHILSELGNISRLDNKTILKLKDLEPIYIKTRYPNYSKQKFDTDEIALNSLKFAEEILSIVKKKIESLKNKTKILHESEIKYNVILNKNPDYDTIKKLKIIKLEISKIIKLDKLFLFGSRARGNFREDSDVDLIIVSDDFENEKNEIKMYHLIEFKNGKDIICLTKFEFERQKKMIGIISDALKYAIEI